jgi:multidrug resistance protein, MATE family
MSESTLTQSKTTFNLISTLRPYLQEVSSLVYLAVPLIAGLMTSTLMGVVDTYMLGSRGEVVLGAVSLTSSVMLIFYAALYGFMGPVGLLVGQAFGAQDRFKISDIIRHGRVIAFLGGLFSMFVMNLGFVLILPLTNQPAEVLAIISPYWVTMSLSLISYTLVLVYKQFYDAIDRPWTGFLLTLVPVLVNVFFNYLLIDGNLGFPAMGLAGAGIATLSASVFGLTLMVTHYRFVKFTQIYRCARPWTLTSFREQLREGMPMSIQYLLEGGAVATMGILIGGLGTTALATSQVVGSVNGLLFMLPLGMAGAVGIRVSQATGSKEFNRIRPISYTALAIVTGWSTLFTIVLLFGGYHIADLFVDEQNIILLASAAFITMSLTQIFDGLQSVSLGALRGILDNNWPTRISLIGYWLISIPAGYVLAYTFNLGVAGFWLGFGFGILFAAVMLVQRLQQKTTPISNYEYME